MSRKRYLRSQSELSECGLACLSICSSILGAELDLVELRKRFPSSQRGLNLDQMIRIAGALDMQGRAVRCEVEDLQQLSLPAILHWKFNHFVVLESARRGRYSIIDPTAGARVVDAVEMSTAFTGVAVEMRTSPSFTRRKERSPLNIWSLLRFDRGTVGALAHTLGYSLLLQMFVLATPYFMQLAMDEGVLRADEEFLAILALGFVAVTVFNSVAEALRGIAVQRVSALLGWDMSGRLVHHMMALPLSWFHRRRLSDTLSRQESIEPIRQLVSNGVIGSVIDGSLAIGIAILMWLYSPPLTMICLAALGAYLGLRLATISYSIRVGMAALQSSIAERGVRIESLRAMQTIKTMGGEGSRETLWANRYADVVRTSLKRTNFQTLLSAARTLIDGLSIVAVVYVGSRSIIEGVLTIGSLYAFVSYRQQLFNRFSTLIDQVIAWRLTEMHSDRIAEIVLTPAEPGLDRDEMAASGLRGDLELKGVAFRHSPFDRPVLNEINLNIRAGEVVALTGPSGCGKSTLVKIMAALYAPTSGDVRYDDVSVNTWGAKAVRRRVGVVMQDDELFSGTLLENVTFFDDAPDFDRFWACLAVAAIDEEVRRMPMQMDTLVGDMGSTLSGGQKQRLLIARAIYRQPCILILDESTANLDVERERRVHEGLSSLQMTRILITHRPETLKLADRVFYLNNGYAIEATRTGASSQPSNTVTTGALAQPVMAASSIRTETAAPVSGPH